MNILIVEDEPSLLSLIRKGFVERSHEVTAAMDGATALQLLAQNQFDVVILDLMLPDISGMEICRRLRAAGKTVPVIMLTALGSSENIVAGLDAGADDYVPKPFKFSELEARVRAVSRRSAGNLTNAQTIQIADLTLNRLTKRVSRNNEVIKLTATEYKLLEYLARNRGMILSRSQLLDNVWDINFDMNTNVVDVYINYLRRKIDKPYGIKLIHTVKGLGYVLREDTDYADPD